MILDCQGGEIKKIRTKLIICSMLTVIVFIGILFSIFMHKADSDVQPEINQNALLVGQKINGRIQKLISVGVPFDQFRGVKEHLQELCKEFPFISYIAISNTHGNILYDFACNKESKKFIEANPIIATVTQQGLTPVELSQWINTRYLIQDKGQNIGVIHLGVNHEDIYQNYKNIFYDTLTVFFAITLITIEFLLFFVFVWVEYPLSLVWESVKNIKQRRFFYSYLPNSSDEIGTFGTYLNQRVRQVIKKYYSLIGKEVTTAGLLAVNNTIKQFHTAQDVIRSKISFVSNDEDSLIHQNEQPHVRMPLFLLIFSESLSLTFLPILGLTLYGEESWIPKGLSSSLGVSLFMLVLAFYTPFATALAQNKGLKVSFTYGASICIGAFILAAVADDLSVFLLSRCILGVGYAISLATSQVYLNIIEERSTNKFLFLSGAAIIAPSATICGASIGSILADYFGYSTTFVLSAFLSAFSLVLILFFLKREKESEVKHLPHKEIKTAIKTLFQRDVAITVLLGIFPTRMIIWTFLFYFVPMYLVDIGLTYSETGRIVILSTVLIILMAPFSVRVSNIISDDHKQLFLAACLMGGAVASLSVLPHNVYSVVLAIIFFSIGNSLLKETSILIKAAQFNNNEPNDKFMFIGFYRGLEKVGGIIGPIMAGLLMWHLGPRVAFFVVGVFVVLLAITDRLLVKTLPTSKKESS